MKTPFDIYRGYHITGNQTRGFGASRYGVDITANTRENLILMIDDRTNTCWNWFAKWAEKANNRK
jgi:hypothetical protein